MRNARQYLQTRLRRRGDEREVSFYFCRTRTPPSPARVSRVDGGSKGRHHDPQRQPPRPVVPFHTHDGGAPPRPHIDDETWREKKAQGQREEGGVRGCVQRGGARWGSDQNASRGWTDCTRTAPETRAGHTSPNTLTHPGLRSSGCVRAVAHRRSGTMRSSALLAPLAANIARSR